MVGSVSVGGRPVGHDHPCFIIAEAGVNHNGDVDFAHDLVDAAKAAGADAVKFQTFRAESLVTTDAPKAKYQQQSTDIHESQLAMLKRLELSSDAHRSLLAHCQDAGLMFLSSPFDEDAADFLSTLPVPAFKVPSGEITNLPFLEHLGRKRLPMIVSTGMSTMDEVAAAVNAIRSTGNQQLVLLHCVSNYPADYQDVNLRAMRTMSNALDILTGYSDHTLGNEITYAAVATGACVIEKHFTLDRGLPGPDHKASLEPAELAAMIKGIRNVEAALGSGKKEPAASERNTAEVARKSLVAACNIPAGSRITLDMLARKRPGTGISPAAANQMVGRTAKRDIPANTLLSWEILS